MSDKKPTLKIITSPSQELFTSAVETFLSKIKKPETVKTTFEVRTIQAATGLVSHTAFILFSGGLED